MRFALVTAALVGALSMLAADPATAERADRYWNGLLDDYVEVQRAKATDAIERGDYEEGLALLTELAEGGDAESAGLLARCYRGGQCGVPADRRSAERWGRRANRAADAQEDRG